MQHEASGQVPVLLCTALPDRADRRNAVAALLVSALLFAAIVPFAKVQLSAYPAFMAAYQSALVINDVITAVLLFAQFSLLRMSALLVLAGGYLFTAMVAIIHALTFPGLFAAGGLLGAGMQTTAWLYMVWHAGFPLAVIGYAFLSRRRSAWPARFSVAAGIRASLAAVLGLLMLATGLATLGEPLLPAIMQGHRYTATMTAVVWTVWGSSFVGLAILARRRRRTVLDLWLGVVMLAWICEIALSAVFNAGRFDLGFYAGRLYGLFASSFVLAMLLTQTLRLYDELATAHHALRLVAQRDGLTGIFNRRWFDECLRVEVERAARGAQPISLLLVDVDHFKRFNDTHGHLAGDECLRHVARTIELAVKRPTDLVARFGGEEFVVLLPATDATGAWQVAEHIRSAVAWADRGPDIPVTVSIGVATQWPDASTTEADVIDAADRALYSAKAAGRNRVVAWEPPHARHSA